MSSSCSSCSSSVTTSQQLSTVKKKIVRNEIYKIKHRIANKKINLTEERIQNHNSSNRNINNMIEERIQKHNSSNRNINMTEERKQKHNSLNTIPQMSPERRIQKINSDRIYNDINRINFEETDQKWDWDNPCQYCGCTFLLSEENNFRKLCCHGGNWKNVNRGWLSSTKCD